MAADRARAERIHDAKAARPDLTWAAIADAVGVRERSAAAWQATGGITHENCVKLAAVLELDPDYLWRGRAAQAGGPTELPDLMGQFGAAGQLDRIEQKADRIEALLVRLLTSSGVGVADLLPPPDLLAPERQQPKSAAG